MDLRQCRVCLTTDDSTLCYSTYYGNKLYHKLNSTFPRHAMRATIQQVLEVVTQSKVPLDKGLPMYICKKCVRELRDANAFILKFYKSREFLKCEDNDYSPERHDKYPQFSTILIKTENEVVVKEEPLDSDFDPLGGCVNQQFSTQSSKESQSKYDNEGPKELTIENNFEVSIKNEPSSESEHEPERMPFESITLSKLKHEVQSKEPLVEPEMVVYDEPLSEGLIDIKNKLIFVDHSYTKDPNQSSDDFESESSEFSDDESESKKPLTYESKRNSSKVTLMSVEDVLQCRRKRRKWKRSNENNLAQVPCQISGKIFDEIDFTRHLKKHKIIERRRNNSKKVTSCRSNQEFACNYCKVVVASYWRLKVHSLKHLGEYNCSYCIKAFADESILKFHKYFRHNVNVDLESLQQPKEPNIVAEEIDDYKLEVIELPSETCEIVFED
ncbi:uncharacterized protein [Euwallacea similis]|uniref:uncharacterized protein n=1 Tax=Euwallacea similis TaxID=1736056 RepID=UPI00344C0FF5